jgi:hypothetical protein
MTRAAAVCMFTLDRVRTVLLALSLIVFVKLALVLLLPR